MSSFDDKPPSARFLVKASHVEVLQSPKEFEELLKTSIESAASRVGIITLYVGAEQEAIMEQLVRKSQQGVEVHLLADYCRTLRPERQKGSSGWKASIETATKTYVKNIQPEKEVDFKFSLFRVPKRFQGLQLFPWRMQETMGVAHWKYYIFDNNVILTGANVADSYLTNREDRWLILKDEKVLVDFLWNLALTLRDHSETVTFSTSELKPIITSPVKPVKDLCIALNKELNSVKRIDASDCDLSDSALLHWGIQCGFDPTPSRTLAKSEQYFIGDALASDPLDSASDASEDDAVTSASSDSSRTKELTSSLVLATPYLNLPGETIAFLRKQIQGRSLEIIGASPDASSFFQGGPVLSAVPWAYLALTCKALAALGSSVKVKYFSFVGGGQQTFHAKGVWNDGLTHGSTYKTLLGSTNMSERSVTRDLECLCLLETRNEDLAEQFRAEIRRFKRVTSQTPKTIDALFRQIWAAPFLTRLISKVFVYHPFFRSIL